MDNKEVFNELFEKLEPRLPFPQFAGVENAWAVYQPSFYTQILRSEENRNIYAEAFDFSTAQKVDTLKQMVLQYLLGKYKGGPLDHRIQRADNVWFGERIDVELPIADTVALDNENVYWKRVAQKKCRKPIRLTHALRQRSYDWKRLAAECKVQEMFETTKKVDWDDEKINAICQAASPYVFDLEVKQLWPIDDIYLEKNRYNPLYKIFNYPPKDCHHGNFGAALGQLTNLVSLELRFGIETLNFSYHKRYFDMSYADIESLAKGLSCLVNLKYLSIVNSRLDDRKCKILVRGFLRCPLEKLDLSYCQLGNYAGFAIGYYLLHCDGSLKSLELRDNNIKGCGWQAIGYGLQNYAGELEYLGVAANPLGEAGVVAIGGGFCNLEQVKRLDMARIEIDLEGPFRLVQMVGFHKRLKWLDLTAVWLGEYLGQKLVEMVYDHWQLEHLAVTGCGLTENQQRKLRLMLERNKFYLKNPCMRKDHFTTADAKEIDEWIVKMKSPILAKIQAAKDHIECPAMSKVSKIPEFIPVEQRAVATNSELLNTYYIDCFGPDSDMYIYDARRHNEKTEEGLDDDEDDFHYDPNQFGQDDFFDGVLLGMHANLASPQYFSN